MTRKFMTGAEPARAETRHGIFTSWRGVPAIELSEIPVLGVDRQCGGREIDISSPLNGNSTELEARSVCHLSLTIEIKVFSE